MDRICTRLEIWEVPPPPTRDWPDPPILPHLERATDGRLVPSGGVWLGGRYLSAERAEKFLEGSP